MRGFLLILCLLFSTDVMGMFKVLMVILITGCSSGIGLELARQLYRTDHKIAITAREASLDKLKKHGLIENEHVIIRALDISKDEERHEVVEELGWRWGGVDVLVNNAGISYRAVVEHMTDEEEIHQMETNYLGAMGLIRLVLPRMREKRFGRIINVSSVGGMMAMPTMSAYSASKFALEGASESLWYELKPWNIKVTLVQPGFIHSDSFKNVVYSQRASKCTLQNDDYCYYYSAMAPFVEKLMARSLTDASGVADQILSIMKMKNPPLRWPATLDARVFFFLRRWMPRFLYHAFLYRMLPKLVRKS